MGEGICSRSRAGAEPLARCRASNGKARQYDRSRKSCGWTFLLKGLDGWSEQGLLPRNTSKKRKVVLNHYIMLILYEHIMLILYEHIMLILYEHIMLILLEPYPT